MLPSSHRLVWWGVSWNPPESIEWFIEGQAFSPSADLAHPPSPPPSHVSKLDRRQTKRLRKRDKLLTGEVEEGGWGARGLLQESLALYESFSSLVRASVHPGWFPSDTTRDEYQTRPRRAFRAAPYRWEGKTGQGSLIHGQFIHNLLYLFLKKILLLISVSGSGSVFGSRRAKWPTKVEKIKKFHYLKYWMFSFESWRLFL
jgi:hypothetical protein